MMTEKQLKLAKKALLDDPSIGRRRLMALCGCTGFAAEKFLKENKVVSMAASAQDTERGRVMSTGIRITGDNMRDRRPSDTVTPRFSRLVRGIGYPISELAAEWGFAERTLIERARAAKVVKYVFSDGDWVMCAVHPDTAKQGRSK